MINSQNKYLRKIAAIGVARSQRANIAALRAEVGSSGTTRIEKDAETGELIIRTGLRKGAWRRGQTYDRIEPFDAEMAEMVKECDDRERSRERLITRTLEQMDQVLHPEEWMSERQFDRAIESGELTDDGVKKWKLDDLDALSMLLRQAAKAGVLKRRPLDDEEEEVA